MSTSEAGEQAGGCRKARCHAPSHTAQPQCMVKAKQHYKAMELLTEVQHEGLVPIATSRPAIGARGKPGSFTR